MRAAPLVLVVDGGIGTIYCNPALLVAQRGWTAETEGVDLAIGQVGLPGFGGHLKGHDGRGGVGWARGNGGGSIGSTS